MSTLSFPETLRSDKNHDKPYVLFSIPEDPANQLDSSWANTTTIALFMTDAAGDISDSAQTNQVATGKARALRGFAGGATPSSADLTVAGIELTSALVPGQGEEFLGIPEIGLNNRVAFNPQTAITFDQVDIRTYSFDYTFVPETANESTTAQLITDFFRKYLYPESSGLYSVKYPPMWRVQFMKGSTRNIYYPVYFDSFLTGVDVKHNPLGRANFPNGAPTSIGLTLTFQEAKQLTRDQLYKKGELVPNLSESGMNPLYGAAAAADDAKELGRTAINKGIEKVFNK